MIFFFRDNIYLETESSTGLSSQLVFVVRSSPVYSTLNGVFIAGISGVLRKEYSNINKKKLIICSFKIISQISQPASSVFLSEKTSQQYF
jgi:hypothetical protein